MGPPQEQDKHELRQVEQSPEILLRQGKATLGAPWEVGREEEVGERLSSSIGGDRGAGAVDQIGKWVVANGRWLGGSSAGEMLVL